MEEFPSLRRKGCNGNKSTYYETFSGHSRTPRVHARRSACSSLRKWMANEAKCVNLLGSTSEARQSMQSGIPTIFSKLLLIFWQKWVSIHPHCCEARALN